MNVAIEKIKATIGKCIKFADQFEAHSKTNDESF
jgi:hypothetical protein